MFSTKKKKKKKIIIIIVSFNLSVDSIGKVSDS